MRKRMVALALALACLTASAGAAVARDEEKPSLYDRGLEVVQVLSEMAGSEEWIDALAGSGETLSVVQAAAGDYSAPQAVYSLSMAVTGREELLALSGLEDAPDVMKAFFLQRTLGSVATRANSLGGAQTLAAASLCTYTKTFVDERAEGDVIYLYTYESAAPVAVTFTLGEDHTVTASGMFILLEDFPCDDAGEIEALFDDIPLEVAQLQPEG